MTIDRRQFLKTTAVAGTALGLGLPLTGCGSKTETEVSKAGYQPVLADKPLKLLILGGTAFLGPACVEAAQARGHELTLFNRGRTNPHLFPDLEKLQGDRKNDLVALEGRQWDAVIDTSGYVPGHVTDSAKLLGPNVGHYVFVSTISVYKDYKVIGMDETAPVGTLEDPTTEEVNGETYGPLKALCEQAAEAEMPGRVTNIRPGLIVGPRDRSDRFTYWPVRVGRGGEVLAPGTPEDLIQFIDVRDLGEFIIHALEKRLPGVYNCDSPAGEYSMGKLLNGCQEVSGSDARFTWCDSGFLEEQEVSAWGDMPCWVPAEDDYLGFGKVSAAKAVAAGLGRRPLDTTIRETINWWNDQPVERRDRMRAGIAPDREAEVLRAWHDRG